jgi:hypothetical protein
MEAGLRIGCAFEIWKKTHDVIAKPLSPWQAMRRTIRLDRIGCCLYVFMIVF